MWSSFGTFNVSSQFIRAQFQRLTTYNQNQLFDSVDLVLSLFAEILGVMV
jgi:hypothetical protein